MDETSLLCNEVELKVLGRKDKPRQDQNCSNSRFSIKLLRVGSAAGVNVPMVFLTKGTNVHPRLRVTNLVTRYGFPEGSFIIPNRSGYTDDENRVKVVKVVSPGIRRMKVINLLVFFLFYSLSIQLSISIPPNYLQIICDFLD